MQKSRVSSILRYFIDTADERTCAVKHSNPTHPCCTPAALPLNKVAPLQACTVSAVHAGSQQHTLPLLNVMHPQAFSKLQSTRLPLQQPTPLSPSLSVCQQLQYCQWCSLMGLHTQSHISKSQTGH
jgi:hypothetical protein